MIFSIISTRRPHHIPNLLPFTPSSPLHAHSLLSLLDRCCTLPHLKQIQAQMVISGLISDPFASSRLIASTAISDSPNLPYCTIILTHLTNPNVFSWNAAVRGYSNSHNPKQSLLLYKQMLETNTRPDHYTFPFLFKACAKMSNYRTGSEILGHTLQLGLWSDLFVFNAAAHLLAACDRLDDARKLFDGSCVRDLVSWNTLINGYVQRGRIEEALDLFRQMELAEVRPDEVTMIGLVSCCTQLQDIDLGRKFHCYIEENGVESTVQLSNALMDMYVKCGCLDQAVALFDGMTKRTVITWTTMVAGYAKFGMLDAARRVFNDMPERDTIPWNALIAGYLHCRRGREVIALFHEMQASHVEPDEVTVCSLLAACSQLGALEMGMWIHQYIERHDFFLSAVLGTALVDMYAKCGNIEKSASVFREIPERNALTWTAIICGLASHGHAGYAIQHFAEMVEIGLLPDEVTFIGVLSACCHAGLVSEGRMFFTQMRVKYGLSPKLKHYSCMVDLLGRAGFLHEAEDLILSMPIEPDSVVWSALFFACRILGNVAMGEREVSKLLELDPHDSGIYVLLENMYQEVHMGDKAGKVRLLMKDLGVEKTPGCSSIEVNGMVYEFIVRDKSHPEWREIYAYLMRLARHMEYDRSVPNMLLRI